MKEPQAMFARLLTLPIWLAALASPPVFAQSQPTGLAKATFAAGCFWCTEEAMDKVPGVISTTSGYMGGSRKNPTYQEVSTGTTGHTEVVQVVYDPKKVSYERLLQRFWVNHDPTVKDRQFCDAGSQYRPSIFWHDEEQKRLAETSKAKWEKEKPFKQPIVTPIVKATEFWPAEDYHQGYYLKNPVRYKFYVTGCGRYARLDELWGKLRK
ncbi:MAG: peptide-methionine (S)-S-oxide reductase [Betaproteobacteria bacterium RIFCSPLOWO2_12_FULL_62_13]|nr:MAG: peptide-methionine (S)-S-oxide reductase [Betaproteobacteria bacterium RIFCSPLOWO2_12_FULL_62_13]